MARSRRKTFARRRRRSVDWVVPALGYASSSYLVGFSDNSAISGAMFRLLDSQYALHVQIGNPEITQTWASLPEGRRRVVRAVRGTIWMSYNDESNANPLEMAIVGYRIGAHQQDPNGRGAFIPPDYSMFVDGPGVNMYNYANDRFITEDRGAITTRAVQFDNNPYLHTTFLRFRVNWRGKLTLQADEGLFCWVEGITDGAATSFDVLPYLRVLCDRP